MLDLLNWDEKGGARLGKKCNIVLVRRLDTSWGNIIFIGKQINK